MSLIDMTGMKFGAWTVVSKVKSVKRGGGASWLCKCECGTVRNVKGPALRRNRTNSCGCNKPKKISEARKKHGHTASGGIRSFEYRSWHGMKARCTYPNLSCYKNYGGRGIEVCDRWLESFENFYEDMGPRPSAYHTLDRIDVNGNYEPTNCRWATILEQNRNKRISATNKTGYSGVIWRSKLNKYEAYIRNNNKSVYLGYFSDIESAIKARKDAELKYWNKEASDR